MFMGPLEESKTWDENGIIGIRKWLDRVYKMYKNFENKKFKINNLKFNILFKIIIII
jgi:leucyl-tRNA synthetase